MRIAQLPRRVRKLNKVYEKQGGVAAYVLAELDGGEKWDDVAQTLTDAIGESVPVDTLFRWVREWRREANEREEVAA